MREIDGFTICTGCGDKEYTTAIPDRLRAIWDGVAIKCTICNSWVKKVPLPEGVVVIKEENDFRTAEIVSTLPSRARPFHPEDFQIDGTVIILEEH